MKLSEAISLRDDLKKKIEQLQMWVLARMQSDKEGKPADYDKIGRELETCLKQLRTVSVQINTTCSHASFDKKGLPQLMAEKEVLELRLRLLNEMMEISASELVSRRIDTIHELLRELETNIQSLLHITELEG